MKHPWLLLTLLASPAPAHDFWIRPSEYRIQPQTLLEVQARVGDDFEGQALPRDPGLVERFFTRAPGDATEREVLGLAGRTPMGLLRPSQPGLHWLALVTQPHRVELSPVRFQVYLAEEGLRSILRERVRLGEADAIGRERFSRCAKSVVLVGDGRGADWSTLLGLPLELVFDRDPADREPGERLSVRLLHNGEPLQGALVNAVRRGATERVLEARTDREGRVRLAIREPGEWLISAVHMARDDDEQSDWRSWWASLTFQVPALDPEDPVDPDKEP